MPKLRVLSLIIAAGVDFYNINLCLMTLSSFDQGVPDDLFSFGAGSDSKSKGRARKNGCANNCPCLKWGGPKGLKLYP